MRRASPPSIVLCSLLVSLLFVSVGNGTVFLSRNFIVGGAGKQPLLSESVIRTEKAIDESRVSHPIDARLIRNVSDGGGVIDHEAGFARPSPANQTVETVINESNITTLRTKSTPIANTEVDQPPQVALADKDEAPKFYSWGSDNVELGPILNFINDTYYHPMTRLTKHGRRYGPFPVFLVRRNNETAVWFPTQALKEKRKNTILENRLAVLLPFIQDALNVLLWKHKRRFQALESALESVGSIPMILDLSDFRGCGRMNYNRTLDSNMAETTNLAILTLSRNMDCEYAFPIPSYKTFEYAQLGDANGTNIWSTVMEEWTKNYSWATKIAKAYWRGGCNDSSENYRRKFIFKCRDRSTLSYIDVRPTNKKCWAKQIKQDPIETSMKYKLVFDIDGNSWSERFPRLLCYNSVVIKINVHDDQEEYFMPRLQPGVHYLAADLGNFTDVAKIALRNDGMMKEIVSNANAWCREYMMIENLQLDLLEILNGLVSRLEVGWMDEWQRVQTSFVGAGALDGHGGFTDQILYETVLNLTHKLGHLV